MTIIENIDSDNWTATYETSRQISAIKALEAGKIILLPKLAFTLQPAEERFLKPQFAHLKAKNISYNRTANTLRCGKCVPEDYNELKEMLARFSTHAETLVRRLFAPYAANLQVGRASLRVTEIEGRRSSYRQDDTRLHVDSFPATPNQGQRILRVFSNVNPYGRPRVWRVGEPFEVVAQRFLPKVTHPLPGTAQLLRMFRLTKSLRTTYDHIMLQIHNLMKADLRYQEEVAQTEVHFAPQTTWIVQTDHVSHAAMSGQHVLEQTFYLPVHAMLDPTLSPLHTLEKISGRKLTT